MYFPNPIDERLRQLQRQVEAYPDDLAIWVQYVQEMRRLGRLEELGFRNDLRPERQKIMGKYLQRIVGSGLLEEMKIKYLIRGGGGPRIIDSPGEVYDNRGGEKAPLIIDSTTLLITRKANPSHLLYLIAQLVFHRHLNINWGRETVVDSPYLVMYTIILHWYFQIPFLDGGDLKSHLDAIRGEGGYDESENTEFIQAFMELKNRGFLDRFGSATKKMEIFLAENYLNFRKIKHNVQKDLQGLEKLKVGPVTKTERKVLGDERLFEIITIQIKVLLKNGEELVSKEIKARLGIITSRSYWDFLENPAIVSIGVKLLPRYRRFFKSMLREDVGMDLGKLYFYDNKDLSRRLHFVRANPNQPRKLP